MTVSLGDHGRSLPRYGGISATIVVLGDVALTRLVVCLAGASNTRGAFRIRVIPSQRCPVQVRRVRPGLPSSPCPVLSGAFCFRTRCG